MIVRFRFGKGRQVQRRRGKNRHIALAMGALLVPASLMAYVMSIWRLASDLGVAGEFVLTGGLFSHWQVWFAIAVLSTIASYTLNRYGNSGDLEVPRLVVFPGKPELKPAPPETKARAR